MPHSSWCVCILASYLNRCKYEKIHHSCIVDINICSAHRMSDLRSELVLVESQMEEQSKIMSSSASELSDAKKRLACLTEVAKGLDEELCKADTIIAAAKRT